MTRGKITISNPRSSKEPDGWIRITIEHDENILDCELTPEAFGLAITGNAKLPCEVTIYRLMTG